MKYKNNSLTIFIIITLVCGIIFVTSDSYKIEAG